MTSKLEAIYNKVVAPRFWKEDVEFFRATNKQEASGEIAQVYESLGIQKAHFVTAGSQSVFGGKQIVMETPTLFCKKSTDIKIDDKIKIHDEYYRVIFVNNHFKSHKEASLVQLDGENFGGEMNE